MNEEGSCFNPANILEEADRQTVGQFFFYSTAQTAKVVMTSGKAGGLPNSNQPGHICMRRESRERVIRFLDYLGSEDE
jgi:hypothetical protein